MGVDALRIDTVKHVPRDNLLEYVNAWKAHKPGLFVFGENLVKGYGWGDLGGGDNGPSFIRPWWYTRLGHDPRDPNSGGDSGFPQLDFGLFSTFRDNLSQMCIRDSGNTLYFVVVGGPLSVAVSLGAALLVSSRLIRFPGFFRAAFFLPVVTTLVAVAVVWRYLCLLYTSRCV